MIGARVSHFEILERLGAGGMGVVYKARDTRLDRFVALKFLHPQRDEEEGRHRFLREARAASALDHPNICTLYEIGETEDGRLFLAMALCEGESLRRLIDRGPLEPAQAAGIAAQIADGLAAAHERGIVHRDVKPGNVLLTPGGRARIVDFGIARLADVTRLTRAGTVLGTAAYMAPEQIRGEEPDPRMDIWSLGVVLYEMLAGRLPFPGSTEAEVIEAILYASPLPLPVAAGCERIVRRALARRPADRWPGAAGLAEELRRWEREIREGQTAGPQDEERTLLAVPRPAGPPAGREPGGLTGRGLDRYRILGPLGTGAMGVVYEAEDLDLGRHVALKFLSPDRSLDPEAKERFLREARAASALDHTNVCTIYEIGESGDGRLFLAMSRYEGETLKKRLEQGPLPVEEALDLGRQIAHGLANAHRHGIVHRDVKPANVMLTRDGVAKILDFGIAQLAGEAGLTRLGAPVGTPAYMSPEQARGEEVGPASDVWSLGAVLYEMLAGRRPFPGDREQAVLYAILHEEPKPLRALRPEVPPEVERIVHRMLARDPAARYPSAEEAHADLKALFGPTSGWTGGRTAVHPYRAPSFRVWVAAALAAAAVAAAVLLAGGWIPGWGRRDRDEPVSGTFTRLTDLEGSETFPSLSPDGTYFLYTKSEGGNADIYLQRVGGGNPMNLTADSPVNDTQAAFSPDGQQIAFRSERAGGGIFLMGATGESVRRLTDSGYNPAWSPDGREILVATEGVSSPEIRRSKSEVWRVEVATGARRLVLRADAVQPSWSPHGRRIAYWGVPAGTGRRVIWTVPGSGGRPVPVTDAPYLNWNPVWSADGEHLYFVSDRGGSMNLWRVPIDEESGEVRGAPEPVTTPAPWSGFLSLSRDGRRIVYATRDGWSNLERAPLVGGRAGELVPVTRGVRAVRSSDVSPDDRMVVFNTIYPQQDLFVVRADGTGLRQLTNDAYKDRSPLWSPDGRRILFYSDRGGHYEAWAIRPDGSGLEPLTQTPGGYVTLCVWSPDGHRLACTTGAGGTALIDLDLPLARRTPRFLPRLGPAGEVFLATSWSPDGRALAGVAQRADESSPGIFLYTFDTRRYTRLAATGEVAIWLRDGRTVLVQSQGKIMAVDAETREVRLMAEPPPHSWFTAVSATADGRALYLVRAVDEGDVWRLDLK